MTHTPNRRGPSAKTAPMLDAMYQHICSHFQPPYYEMPTTRQLAAEFGIVQPEACRYLRYLEQDGRLIRSPAGKLVPRPQVFLADTQGVSARKKVSNAIKEHYLRKDGYSDDAIRSILQAVPTSEQTGDDHEWLNHRE